MSDQIKPDWRRRRAIIHLTLIFCAVVVAYLTGWGEDTRLHETIIQFAFITAGGVIGSYVFGATWEDVTRLRK